MNNWKETTLGEIVRLNYGKGLTGVNRDKGEVPVYGSSGITGYHSSSLVSEESLIIGRKGTVGAMYKSKIPFFPIDTVYFIRKSETKCDWNFLWYLLKFIKLDRLNFDAVIPGLNREVAYAESIYIPERREEQKQIAAVLSSLDDKIELLRAENETLEKIAQGMFREWFILNIDLKKQRLGDMVQVKRGGSPRPIQDYISKAGLRWLKISDASATASPFIFEIKECIKEEGLNKTTLLKSGSLILSNSATPGISKILAVDSCIHDGWLHFPKSRFSNEFLYLLFQEIRPQLIQQGSGSVFTNLKTDILKNYEAPLPSDDMLKNFDNAIKPMFQKIFNNASQIQTLSRLRDTLLPKLMSGEIKVNA